MEKGKTDLTDDLISLMGVAFGPCWECSSIRGCDCPPPSQESIREYLEDQRMQRKRDKAPLPEIGKEYLYLDQPVTVRRVIPMEGDENGWATVEFETRFSEPGECRARDLRPVKRPD